jgi:phosphomannomutase
MGLILEYLAKSGKSVSGLVAELPSYEMIKEKIECPFAKAADALAAACSSCGNARVDTTDGIKMVWPDKWVHVRNSNTEPIIRIIAEARSRNAAEDLYTQVSKKIKEAVGI